MLIGTSKGNVHVLHVETQAHIPFFLRTLDQDAAAEAVVPYYATDEDRKLELAPELKRVNFHQWPSMPFDELYTGSDKGCVQLLIPNPFACDKRKLPETVEGKMSLLLLDKDEGKQTLFGVQLATCAFPF